MPDERNRDAEEKQLKGAAREAEGKLRNKIGDLTGDRSEQLKGKAQEFRGKVERKIGEAESDIDD